MLTYLGWLCILGGIYFLLVNLNWFQKSKETVSHKPVEAQKVDNLLIRFFSIATLVVGIYLVLPSKKTSDNSENNFIKAMPNQSPAVVASQWNDNLISTLMAQCIENGKKTAEEYPDLVNDYCKCATEHITGSMTPSQYHELMSKSGEEQSKTIRPIVSTCVDILTKLIQLSQEQKPDVKVTK